MTPGTLLVAAPSEDSDRVSGRTVVAIVDREPNGITTGLVINRRLEARVADTSALALLFVPEPDAHAFWGGPMGNDPAVLAQFSDVEGLDWFHLSIEQRRPFLLPDVGIVAVAEHPEPFEGRILRARLFVGLCVWGRGQLEAELDQAGWLIARPTLDDLFTPDPDGLWAALSSRV